ncbi:MAG: hypothetical protein R2776_00265 [Flavobacteriaceae bacterium]|nr:hypothetical protein [Flavobacteriaceae bacterium]
MKNQLFILLFLSISISYSQSFNKEQIEDSIPNLIGKFNKEALLKEPYEAWFQKNFNEYQPKESVINQLKTLLPQYTITLFMGTWCGDSKRETPRLFKIMETANYPMDRITSIALGRKNNAYKQSPGGEHEGLHIHRVPTFIIYKDGKEINRIVEHPVVSLEEDLLQILTGSYQNYYYGVSLANFYLEKYKPQKLIASSKKISKEIAPYIHSKYDLNTFCKVLLAQNKKEDAEAVATINTYLYPKETSVYETLANIQGLINKKEDAIKNYKKALEINPNNEDLKSLIKLFSDELKSKN